MSDQTWFDLGSAAMLLVIIAVVLAVLIRLIPVLAAAVWHVVPSVVVLWLIVAVLRGMMHKLLD